MAGYPKAFNIEMDPHEDLDVTGLYTWSVAPVLKAIEEYKETLKEYPNPPAVNFTKF